MAQMGQEYFLSVEAGNFTTYSSQQDREVILKYLVIEMTGIENPLKMMLKEMRHNYGSGRAEFVGKCASKKAAAHNYPEG